MQFESIEKKSQTLPSSEQSGLNLLKLSQAVKLSQSTFSELEDLQNPVGKTIDWVKNTLGASHASSFAAGRLWSNVISSDEGSESVQKQLDLAQDVLKRASNPELGKDGAVAREFIADDATTKALGAVQGYYENTFLPGVEAANYLNDK